MSKCNKCGKGGLFFKVNENGICNNCEINSRLQIAEKQLRDSIEKSQKEFFEIEKSYKEMKNKKDILYSEISNQAKQEAIEQISSIIEEKNSDLQNIQAQYENQKSNFMTLHKNI